MIDEHSISDLNGNSPADSFTTSMRVCYEVLLYLNSRMSKLAPGEILEFMTDDADAVDAIPAWCDLRGFLLIAHELLPDRRWRFIIQQPPDGSTE